MIRPTQFMDGFVAMDVLGITTDMPCNAKVLKSAYRKKAKETHPDKEGGTHEAFVKVKEAYDSLVHRLKCVNQPRPQPVGVVINTYGNYVRIHFSGNSAAASSNVGGFWK